MSICTIPRSDTDGAVFTVHYSFHRATIETAPLPILVLAHRASSHNIVTKLIYPAAFNNSREYWQPQLDDPQLAQFDKIVLDSLGFADSSTRGIAWTFDQAAESILAILKAFPDRRAVIIGDSMGGGPTGLRCALLDSSSGRNIAGVVAIGTSAEEESPDFVTEYTSAAHAFALECHDGSKDASITAIEKLATNMANDGYTTLASNAVAREWGQKVIVRSLKKTLANNDGILEPHFVGSTMVTNYACLNNRPTLIPRLSARPSPIRCSVLVIHGDLDKAVSHSKYSNRE